MELPVRQQNDALPELKSPIGGVERQPALISCDLDRIMSDLPNGFATFDRQWQYTYANNRLLEIFELSRAEVIGKRAWEVFPHQVSVDFFDLLHRAMNDGVEAQFQYYYELVDLWVEHRVYPNADGLAILMTDITERKQAEKISQLAAKFDYFRLTLADALRPLADPVAIQATASRVLGEHLGANRVAYFEIRGANYAIERDYVDGSAPLLGNYPIDSFGAKLLAAFQSGRVVTESDIAAAPDLSPAEKAAFAAVQIGAYIGVPLIKDGEFVAGLAINSIAPRVWTSDEIAIAQEVAERTWAALERARAEAALRESEAKYRTLFESMDEGYVLIDLIFDEHDAPVDFDYLEANPAAVVMMGIDPVGLRATAIYTVEPQWSETLGRVAKTGIGERHELPATQLDNWYNFYVFKIGNADSRRVAMIFEDVTERKRREANIAFLTEIQDEFTRLVSADEIMQTIGAKIGAYLNVTHCLFADIDETQDKVVIESGWHTSDTPDLIGVYQISELVSEEFLQAARAKEIIVINNTQTDARTDADRYAAPEDLLLIASQGFDRQMTERFVRVNASSNTPCGLAMRHDERIFVYFDVPESEDPDGAMRLHVEAGYLSAQSTPLISRTGKPLGMISTHWRSPRRPIGREVRALDLLARQAADLIEQQHTTAALRESEEQLRLASDAAKVGMWFWNIETDTIIFTEQCKALFGLPAETEISYAVFEAALHPDDRDRTQAAVTRSMEDRTDYDIEYRSCWSDGSVHWIAAKGSCTYDPTGKPVRMMGVVIDINALKQAQLELQQSSAILNTINEATPSLIYVKDRQGRVRMGNPALMRVLGKPESEVIGYTDAEFYLNPDDATVIMETDRQVMATGLTQVVEETLDLPEGRRTFLSTKSPYADETGTILGLVGVSFDISLRKQSEEALRQSEAQLAIELADTQQLQHISSQLIREDNINALYQQILDAAIALMGAEMGSVQMLDPARNELKLLAWRGFTPAAVEAWKWVRSDSASTCGAALLRGERIFVPDVETCDFMAGTDSLDSYRQLGIRAAQSTPLISRHGRLVGMISTHCRKPHQPNSRRLQLLDVLARQVADLLDRKQIEEALQRSEEQSRTILESITDAFIALDENWRYTYVNSTAEELHLRPPGYLVGKNIWDEYPELLGSEFEQIYRGVAASGVADSMVAFYPDHDRWYEVRVYPVGNGLSIYCSNVTDRKQMEIALAERNQELDSFVYIVSHDLKAPLRAISNLSVWIEEDLGTDIPTQIGQQMTQLRGRVQRMEGMITGLLDYARVGSTDAQIQLVSVTKLLADILDSIAPPPTFEMAIAPELPTFHTKGLLLSQVFTNLISNAFKHHDKSGGCIQISCHERGNFYEFAVSDDGPGISPEQRDRVFIIFQAANPKKNPDSTGIGLSIVKKIVETAGGQIRLESELGKGTTFYFTWPK